MAVCAGLRLSCARLFYRIRAIRPLLGTASRYRPGLGLVAIGVFFWVSGGVTHAQAPIRIGASVSIDRDGVQIAHKMVMFQWQDGKKVIVWPGELAPCRRVFQRRRGNSDRR